MLIAASGSGARSWTTCAWRATGAAAAAVVRQPLFMGADRLMLWLVLFTAAKMAQRKRQSVRISEQWLQAGTEPCVARLLTRANTLHAEAGEGHAP